MSREGKKKVFKKKNYQRWYEKEEIEWPLFTGYMMIYNKNSEEYKGYFFQFINESIMFIGD